MKKKIMAIRNAEGEVVATYPKDPPEEGEWEEEMEVDEDYYKEPGAFHKKHKKEKPKK